MIDDNVRYIRLIHSYLDVIPAFVQASWPVNLKDLIDLRAPNEYLTRFVPSCSALLYAI